MQECVKTGDVVSLSLPLSVPGPAFFGRKPLKHKIKSIGPGAFDDEISINTQSSSQWDGFRHFAHPQTGCHYNGVASDEIMGDLHDSDDDEEENEAQIHERSRRLGIDAWAKKGIVGRGVLLDIFSWSLQRKERTYDPFTTHQITASDLRACAAHQNITFRTGDILLIRTGWLHTYTSLSAPQKLAQSRLPLHQHTYAGLSASESMKDFLHDGYFAAAATDNANFEAWPPPSFEESLHASLLPLWGMPIGELWDLEGLGKKCKDLGRWTFGLVSAPGNVPGGVGSALNALALF